MVQYERPDLPSMTFRDAAGAVIEYGRRWPNGPGGEPPPDAYSRVTHPERFVPLHAVAEALIDYLAARYDVIVTDGLALVDELNPKPRSVVRAVRIAPADQDGAPLVFVFTDFPAIRLYAGRHHDFLFPDCGCDACDETAEGQCDGFEEVVFAVAEGRFQETYDEHGDSEAAPTGHWTTYSPLVKESISDLAPGGFPRLRAGYRIVARDGSFRQAGGTLADRQRNTAAGAAPSSRVDYRWQAWKPRAE